jgi:hypothetical protein
VRQRDEEMRHAQMDHLDCRVGQLVGLSRGGTESTGRRDRRGCLSACSGRGPEPIALFNCPAYQYADVHTHPFAHGLPVGYCNCHAASDQYGDRHTNAYTIAYIHATAPAVHRIYAPADLSRQ